jgi:type IV pilus assembly protein PilW
MKIFTRSFSYKKLPSGFTILELMVALLVALILTLAIGQVFLGNRKTSVSQDQVSRIQENGRYAVDVLNRTIREAGFQYFQRIDIPQRFYSSAPVELTMAATNPSPVNGINASSAFNSSDEITVRFYGSSAAAGGAADGGVIDCTGRPVADRTLSVNRFYVAARSDVPSEPALWCQASSPTAGAPAAAALELATGIEGMQILYGMADSLENPQNVGFLPAGAAGLDMNRVLSVRVSLLARGDDRVIEVADTRDYQHFGVTYAANEGADAGSKFTASGDKRPRRQFSQVIALRNRTK